MGFQTGVFKFEGLQFLHVMVFFICNGCGASLKKNNVEKHQTHQCRKSGHLSCMDCSKDFFGEDYKGHVKCISEEEKYSAKGWSAKPNQNKNERKQTEWVAMVQELASSVDKSDPALSRVLQTISQHENIPRKKAKFLNFLKNIFGPRPNLKIADLACDVESFRRTACKSLKGTTAGQRTTRETECQRK